MKSTSNARGRSHAVLISVLALTLAAVLPLRAEGQSAPMHSNWGAIQLNATLPGVLRLSLSEVNLDIKVVDPSQSSAVVTVPVTSTWVLDSSTNNVGLVGYFDSPAVAMQDNAGHVIPSSHVMGGLADEAMLPFVETSQVGTANASRTFFRQHVSKQNVADSRTDILRLQLARIDDIGAPAAEYRGILHLRLTVY